MTGKKAEEALDEVGITCNKNTIPFDEEKPFITSGLRIGTPAATTRGFKEEDFEEVGKIISLVLKNSEDQDAIEEGKSRVKALTTKHPLYQP